MIEATGLTKRYGGTVAVDDLSFTVPPGQVTGFLGPNGAGKSTTMRLILGPDAPDSGAVTVSGRPYTAYRVRPDRPPRRMTKGSTMFTAEADIQTEHAVRYLARLCGHADKMGTAGLRLGHRPRSHARDGVPPEIRQVECSETERTVSLDCGQWTMRASPGLLAVRAEAADQEGLRQIQDLLTSRLQKFGHRERLTVNWRDGSG